jgi:LEA14-like dessication related protein
MNVSRSRARTILLICAGLSGLLQACSSMQPDYEEPVVSVTSFRPLAEEGSGLSFEIGLRIVNPNSEPLELQGIAYTIALDGRKLITGVSNDLPTIEGYSEETLTLQASASMYQAIRFFGDMMQGSKDSVQYKLSTKLDVGTFRPAIRIEESGEIALQPGNKK